MSNAIVRTMKDDIEESKKKISSSTSGGNNKNTTSINGVMFNSRSVSRLVRNIKYFPAALDHPALEFNLVDCMQGNAVGTEHISR